MVTAALYNWAIQRMPPEVTNATFALEPGKGIPLLIYGITETILLVLGTTQLFGQGRETPEDIISIAFLAVWTLVYHGKAWLFVGAEESLRWALLGYQVFRMIRLLGRAISYLGEGHRLREEYMQEVRRRRRLIEERRTRIERWLLAESARLRRVRILEAEHARKLEAWRARNLEAWRTWLKVRGEQINRELREAWECRNKEGNQAIVQHCLCELKEARKCPRKEESEAAILQARHKLILKWKLTEVLKDQKAEGSRATLVKAEAKDEGLAP
ncbi:MAG: hypothetical protein M1812_003594 [Candelaria pacifica]|nr:MAG: hypothetical protein M1812_003594 [Candelaria pacifica]